MFQLPEAVSLFSNVHAVGEKRGTDRLVQAPRSPSKQSRPLGGLRKHGYPHEMTSSLCHLRTDAGLQAIKVPTDNTVVRKHLKQTRQLRTLQAPMPYILEATHLFHKEEHETSRAVSGPPTLPKKTVHSAVLQSAIIPEADRIGESVTVFRTFRALAISKTPVEPRKVGKLTSKVRAPSMNARNFSAGDNDILT